MSRLQSPTGFIYCFVCAVEVDNDDVKEKFSRQFIKIILSILQQRTESLAIRPTLFNQSQISSDRLNIFELGCLLYPLRKKRKLYMQFFYYSEQLNFYMSLGFADVSGLLLKGWVKSFQDQTFLLNLFFF